MFVILLPQDGAVAEFVSSMFLAYDAVSAESTIDLVALTHLSDHKAGANVLFVFEGVGAGLLFSTC